ncbi:hypothetical protein VRRI112168_20240 [Vreelandella rituensis]
MSKQGHPDHGPDDHVQRQATLAQRGHTGFFKTGVDQFGREYLGETGEIVGYRLGDGINGVAEMHETFPYQLPDTERPHDQLVENRLN